MSRSASISDPKTSSKPAHFWRNGFLNGAAFLAICCGTVLALVAAGCSSGPADTTPRKESMRSIVRDARPANKNDIECKCISSRANEIEADLGAKTSGL
jgi:hypothetical protein